MAEEAVAGAAEVVRVMGLEKRSVYVNEESAIIEHMRFLRYTIACFI